MRKFNLLLIACLSLTLLFVNCNKDEDEEQDSSVIGNVTVALDANKSVLRGEEALMGNMFGEAWMSYAKESLGKTVDFALPNGGNLRFNEDTRPDGIYPAGDYTMSEINEICFYDNNLLIVEVTGEQLKQILERSVSSLPTEYKGWFLQCSHEISYTANLANQVQVLNGESDIADIEIVTPGERITSIKVNGTDYSPTATYKIIVTDYMAEGNDGYPTLRDIDAAKKENLGDYRQAIIYYLKNYSPVTPVKEGRITITN